MTPESKLSTRRQKGKQVKLTAAEQALVMENLEYVTRVARRFYRHFGSCGIDLDDFLSAGYIGLCRSAQRYDQRVGKDFKLFSFLRVRGAMYDLLRRHSGVSRSMYKAALGRERIPFDCVDSEVTAPTPSSPVPKKPKYRFSIAHTATQLRSLNNVIEQAGIRVHQPNGEEGVEISYANARCPEQLAHESSIRRYLQKLLDELPEQQRTVLTLRYYKELSYLEMGTELEGATKSWLSRIHARAIDQLRDRLLFDRNSCSARASNHGGVKCYQE